MTPSKSIRFLLIGSVLGLGACTKPFDVDLRGLTKGFSTSEAVKNLPDRPRPDSNGVLSYSNYQVALARKGETPRKVAARLGVDANALARLNGIAPDAALREGELLALPSRVASTAPTQPTVTTLPSGADPLRHQVKAGETAYSVARLYDVPVQSLAQWNNLDGSLSVRTGQQLLIPVAGASAPTAPTTTQPGQGSPTPTPPSAATALPTVTPAAAATVTTAPTSTPTAAPAPAPAPAPQPAPKLETTQASTSSARLAMPVPGNIIRAYAKGRNEGIDISAPAGTPVKAAEAGTVAAVTANTTGAKIIVIKHSGGLLTVYVNVTDLTVSKGSSVRRGQTIAKVASGDPSALHFEVRKGLESQDPADYLP